MAALDFKKVRDAADICRVAETLGLPIRHSGSARYIHCPLHDDKHPSCMIRPGQKHAYCFVCGKSISCFDLVMYTTGADFSEAVETVWQSEGCPSFCLTETKDREKKRTFSISASELQFLGIHLQPHVLIPVRETKGREFFNSEMPAKGSYSVSKEGRYLAQDRSNCLTWQSFLSEKDMKDLVLQKCQEKERKLKRLSRKMEEAGEKVSFSEQEERIASIRERAKA